MNVYLDLFITFARIGGLTFGGGYAMLPMLEREVVDHRHWATSDELMDYYAIGQCTPGVIAVNTATFVGRSVKGIPGGIIATLGVAFPSLVIITIIAALISNFADIPAVARAFAGIRIGVCVLVFNAVLKLGKAAIKDSPSMIIFLIVFLGSSLLDVSPVIFVILAAIAGILLQVKKA